MDDNQRTHLEERLLRERARVLKSLAQFDERAQISLQEDDGDLTGYPFHLADEGTDTMEREKDFLLASKEGRIVYWIDDALRLLYQDPDQFGRCRECGGEIVFERLDIIPWTRTCVDCQRMQEDGVGRAA